MAPHRSVTLSRPILRRLKASHEVAVTTVEVEVSLMAGITVVVMTVVVIMEVMVMVVIPEVVAPKEVMVVVMSEVDSILQRQNASFVKRLVTTQVVVRTSKNSRNPLNLPVLLSTLPKHALWRLLKPIQSSIQVRPDTCSKTLTISILRTAKNLLSSAPILRNLTLHLLELSPYLSEVKPHIA
jgi:hypothetical protein